MQNLNSREENEIERANQYQTSRILVDGKPFLQDEYFESEPNQPKKDEQHEKQIIK